MPQDVTFGTIAALISAILCYYIAKKSKKRLTIYILAPLSVVITKLIIVGIQITIFQGGNLFFNFLHVGIGELAACYLLGVPLMFLLYKNDLYKKIFN